MRLIALDGATRTGYSIWNITSERVVLEQYGAIQLKHCKKDYLTIQELGQYLDLIIEQDDFVVIEDIYGRFYKAMKFLIKLQFFLQSYLQQKGIQFADPIPVSEWKGSVGKAATKNKEVAPATGIKGLFEVKEVDKETSISIVKGLLNSFDDIDDNMSDSILIAIYYIRFVLNIEIEIDFSKAKKINYGVGKK
ncbi:hypothetical protein MKX70_20135 [Paenibacillus sp. FSL R7-0312]|uniref:hypothetical protein n=1 Tax=Paenibacillus sp. FSL R7-0312 TaxID=2921682 RepID=UPI0030FC417F